MSGRSVSLEVSQIHDIARAQANDAAITPRLLVLAPKVGKLPAMELHYAAITILPEASNFNILNSWFWYVWIHKPRIKTHKTLPALLLNVRLFIASALFLSCAICSTQMIAESNATKLPSAFPAPWWLSHSEPQQPQSQNNRETFMYQPSRFMHVFNQKALASSNTCTLPLKFS